MDAVSIIPGRCEAPVLHSDQPLSFWGGVDPGTGRVIDIHHPLHGKAVSGAILLLPGARGSCSGSGVMLDLLLSGRAPAALIFTDPEDVVTLGVLVAAELFAKSIPVLRVDPMVSAFLSDCEFARITEETLHAGGKAWAISQPESQLLDLTADDTAQLAGEKGAGAQAAMRIICAMARQQGARCLVDVSRGHIDGCIYASPANLIFAERFAEMGAQVRVPTTMNAISVDHRNWREQGTPPVFGMPAQKLADAYVRMGCQPTFTCSPYLLEDRPARGENIAWAESNAVIFANSVLGARTAKHPDFLDLCIAVTGRAPMSGVYLDEHRQAQRILDVGVPQGVDDAFWPLVGYVAGLLSPDRIPLLRGLSAATPTEEHLRALCAAFGTTSSAPMLHIEGVTPEAALIAPGADRLDLDADALRAGWDTLNAGPEEVQLVAIGSPHASLQECRAFALALAGRKALIPTIITAGRSVASQAEADGTLERLRTAGVRIVTDLCWCSITEPLFPVETRTAMTNSGKYAHYGPGLSGRELRFGSLHACAEAAVTGRARTGRPDWLADR